MYKVDAHIHTITSIYDVETVERAVAIFTLFMSHMPLSCTMFEILTLISKNLRRRVTLTI